MSALTLLSVIAPAVPVTPQGAANDDASGFQSLLVALTGEATEDRGTGITPAEGPVSIGLASEAQIEVATLIGFPGALLPPPSIPVALLSAEEPVAGSRAEPEADPIDDVTANTRPADKGLTLKTPDPVISAPAIDGRPVRAVEPTPPLALAQAAAMTDAGEHAPKADATAAAAPVQPPAAALPQTPAPSPAPLRPLKDSSSRTVETVVGKSGDGLRTKDANRPATEPVSTAVSAPGGDKPARPADLAVAAIPRDGGGQGGADPASDLPQSGEAAAAQAEAPAAARDPAASTLSRATIEATAQIAAQILRRLEGRSTRFEMALTPDELGRVDVKLDIDSEGRLNARLAFDNPAAATDMRGRADELRRQLQDAGFHLAEDAFEFADRDSGSSAFDRGQNGRDGSSRAFAAASRLNTEIDVAQPPRWMALSLSPSGVDMKV
ncbi:flagellar hook-length control protein FliK [Phenylobacterium sp.]|uniref:flagellar hook-length control protein FliK n=1 Tax=Phenylobacterium sp. TaxID=1871053 RepID=UPI00272F7E52|nr:flagellar hook-length control protein FliK [Phenylobacterium sp.]MDP2212230.1 flagellar hook-length control protein FliK [Phenylobacterium sp.]